MDAAAGANMVDFGELESLVRMCDQKNGGDHGELSNSDDDLSASDESEPEERPSNAIFDLELDGDDEDDVAVPPPAAPSRGQTPFSLRGGSSAFSSRSHSIFECLDSVARLAPPPMNPDSGPESDQVFARPLPPQPSRKTSQPPPSSPTPAKKSTVPDYLVHPERWTRYSLEDVAETSEQGNSRAAHNFLSSLQQRKEPQESSGDSSDGQQKMVFSRPSRLLNAPPADQPSAVRGKEKETRLSHLEEEEEEEGREKEEPRERTDQRVEKTEEKDTRAAVGRPEEKKQVLKEKEEKEESNPAFASFRKTKRVNYRKSSGRDDN